MKYNFDAVVDRSNTHAAKYDERIKKFGTDNVIPLWIADMDFKTAQPIIDALTSRAQEGIWGYTSRGDSYFEAYANWQTRRHNWTPDTSLMSFCLGVVPALSAIVKSFTPEDSKVLIQTPVYPEFYDVTEAWHRQVIENRMIEKDGKWEVDWDDFEAKGKKQVAPYHQGEINLHDKNEVEKADRKRFEFVNKIVSQVETRKVLTKTRNTQDKIDAVLANKWLGIPIFAVVMWLVFDISQSKLGPFLADILVGWIETFQGYVAEMVSNASPFLQSLLVDGIIGGVGAVVGFLPLVMVMYFLIALLEDCGYMARVSVVMDPIFKRVGLSGKSIIPMVIGTGCAIPGVMACRTIKNERERRTTAMLTPFMPCGAKLPVIALFAGAFFSDASWVGTLMYFVGILLIVLSSLLILKITGHKYRKSFFIMELPEYKIPSLKRAVISMFSRAKAYIIKAGTIILVCNAAVQIMQSFNWQLQLVPEGMEHTSILASIASPFAVLLIPLGFGAWQLAAAAITGFIAKENVVGTIAVVYGLTNFINVDDLVLTGGANTVATTMGLTSVAALAYLMFNLYTPPCFAAIGAMNSEIKDKKWLLGGIGLQFGAGYTVAFLVYQIGTLITTGSVGQGFLPGLVVVLAIAAFIIRLIVKENKRFDEEYSLGNKSVA